MLVINDSSALAQVTDPEVRGLIQRRMDEFGSDADLATFIVVEPGDPLGPLDAQLGFPILSNRFDGKRHGDPGFAPSFEVLEEHPGCYEMVFVLADYGDGVLVFVPKHDGINADLQALRRTYASPEQSAQPRPRADERRNRDATGRSCRWRDRAESVLELPRCLRLAHTFEVEFHRP